jgi:hypothetical protein
MALSSRLPAPLVPLSGALLGVFGYGLIALLPRGPGAVAALAMWTAATLAEGERGLARWFPRLPLSGSLLAFCTILVRWYALMSLQLAPGIVAAMALGPAASVALAWVSRPVDDAAFRRLSVLTAPQAAIAMAEGAAMTLFCGVRTGIVLVLVTWLLLRGAAALENWRWGGVRGSDLEAFRVLVETGSLTLLAIMAV